MSVEERPDEREVISGAVKVSVTDTTRKGVWEQHDTPTVIQCFQFRYMIMISFVYLISVILMTDANKATTSLGLKFSNP